MSLVEDGVRSHLIQTGYRDPSGTVSRLPWVAFHPFLLTPLVSRFESRGLPTSESLYSLSQPSLVVREHPGTGVDSPYWRRVGVG